jgi:hypothetical protein
MQELITAIEDSGFATWVRESPSIFAYTAILSLHAIGLAIVAGLSGVVALRLLGFAPAIPLAPATRLFPLMYAGFWINAASGVALLAANASGMLSSTMFFVKMGFVAAAVLIMRLIRGRVFGDAEIVRSGNGPSVARGLAAASLLCWLGAIGAGRLTAYPYLLQGLWAS